MEIECTTEQLRLQYNATNYLSVTVSNAGVAAINTYGNIITTTSMLKHPDYASQTTNWGITAAGAADFRYLYTDALHAKSFIADLEQALAGGQIISKSVAILGATFTVPAAGAAATLTVEDFPSAPNMAVFETGDRVRLRTFSRAAGSLTIADCWGIVTNYADQTGGVQTWTFTRLADPHAGGIVATTVIATKSIVLDYGITTNGFYEVNSIDGVHGINSPYSQVVTWAGTPDVQTVRVRTGNLLGITTVAEYGFFAGSYSGHQYIRASDIAFEMHGINFVMYDGGTAVIKMDRTAPSFALGSSAPTAYDTGTGVWMGKDTSYKFRVGEPSNGYGLWWNGSILTWKGTNTTLDASGNLTASSADLTGKITATSGAIAGWVTDTNSLTKLSSTTKYCGIRSDGTLRFFAGASDAVGTGATYTVSDAGVLTATGAVISGSIATATSGVRVRIGLNGLGYIRIYDAGTVFTDLYVNSGVTHIAATTLYIDTGNANMYVGWNSGSDILINSGSAGYIAFTGHGTFTYNTSAIVTLANSFNITEVGALSVGSIAPGFTAITDTFLATISTAGKVSGTAVTSGNIATSGTFATTGASITAGNSSNTSEMIVFFNGITAPSPGRAPLNTGMLLQSATAHAGSGADCSPAIQLKHFAYNNTKYGGAGSAENSWFIQNWGFQTSNAAGGVLAFTCNRPNDNDANGKCYTSFAIDELGRTIIGYNKDQTGNYAGYYGFIGENFVQGTLGIDIFLCGNTQIGWQANGVAGDCFVNGEYRLIALNTAPANAGATGILGEIRYTADYIYVCTADNTWKRAAIATW